MTVPAVPGSVRRLASARALATGAAIMCCSACVLNGTLDVHEGDTFTLTLTLRDDTGTVIPAGYDCTTLTDGLLSGEDFASATASARPLEQDDDGVGCEVTLSDMPIHAVDVDPEQTWDHSSLSVTRWEDEYVVVVPALFSPSDDMGTTAPLLPLSPEGASLSGADGGTTTPQGGSDGGAPSGQGDGAGASAQQGGTEGGDSAVQGGAESAGRSGSGAAAGVSGSSGGASAPASDLNSLISSTVTIRFPGAVISASGSPQIDASTVTYTDAEHLSDGLIARGYAHSGQGVSWWFRWGRWAAGATALGAVAAATAAALRRARRRHAH